MSIGPLGENLVFLVSQPRAGSTLLQRMLAAHGKVATASEPWVMLHPLYARRAEGHTAEYNATLAHDALREFLATTPGVHDDWNEGLRRMHAYLYDRALTAKPGATHFVDKTPRYYLILPELVEVFPAATFVILLRNPLAVLCSLITTWAYGGRLHHLSRWVQDLNDGPRMLLEGAEAAGSRAVTVRYEEMLADPEPVLRRIGEKAGLDYDPAMIEYGRATLPRWAFGDTKKVYGGDGRPDAQNAERWMEEMKDPQMWRLASEYLSALDPRVLTRMGYDPQRLRAELDARRPTKGWVWTRSMKWLSTPAPAKLRTAKHGVIRFCHLAGREGPGRAVKMAFRKGLRGACEATTPEKLSNKGST